MVSVASAIGRYLQFTLMLSVILIPACATKSADKTGDHMSRLTNADNEVVVKNFMRAWSSLDPKILADYFAEDGIYYNMPTAPVQGRDNIQKFITGFIQPWQKTDWTITNILSQGDLVIVERIDKTTINGKVLDLPCVGVFELENGKIKEWRDYFDLNTYTKNLSPR